MSVPLKEGVNTFGKITELKPTTQFCIFCLCTICLVSLFAVTEVFMAVWKTNTNVSGQRATEKKKTKYMVLVLDSYFLVEFVSFHVQG